MKVKDIVVALNHYYLAKFPNAKGWFIVKETTEPTLINAYKKKRAELYYHVPGKNQIAITTQLVDRCIDGHEEAFEEAFTMMFLEQILKSLEEFDKYETV